MGSAKLDIELDDEVHRQYASDKKLRKAKRQKSDAGSFAGGGDGELWRVLTA